MNWYKIAQKLYENIPEGGSTPFIPWPKYPSDEKAIKKYIEKENQKPSRWIPVDSSFIKEIAYHKGLQFLDVKLKNGNIYSYADVPLRVFKAFLKSKSKGEFFNLVIKDKYSAPRSV